MLKSKVMKKIILSVSVALLAITMIAACSKKGAEVDLSTPKLSTINGSAGLPDYYNVGLVHNLGLQHLIETNDLNNTSTNSELLSSFMLRTFEFLDGTDLYHSSPCGGDELQTSTHLSYALNNGFYGDANATFTWALNLLGNQIGSIDLGYINSARLMMSSAEHLPVKDRASFVSKEIINLINKYNAETSTQLEPTLTLGFLHTLLHSNAFWAARTNVNGGLNDFEITDPNNPSAPPIVLVPMVGPMTIAQVDAAGYLYGWTQAWAVDQLPNPECRIAAGKRMAMQWSAVAIARAILG
ncbi:MAG: hypothetical protein BGO31_00900 [Bacteroidetes bacterium 43-16]|nr:MAG: hypothetical protein BGO31_00900 [Bacteroidetes bacterium 43-16]